MRILYHHRTQGKGVEGIHIIGVVGGLRRLGHEVEIVCLPGANPELGVDRAGKGEQKGVYAIISRFAPRFLFDLLSIVYNLYLYRRLRNAAECRGCDLVYERYAFFSFACLLFAKRNGLPLILEVNNLLEEESVRRIRLKSIGRWIEKHVLRNVSHIFTVSSYLKNRLVEKGIHEDDITVLPNAIDEQVFSPDKCSAKDRIVAQYGLREKTVIGFVGLFVPWHGLDFLLKRFADLCKAYPFIHLLLVGDGPERKKLERRIEDLGLIAKVSITGFVTHAEVRDYIGVMDIAVMPDSNHHGSPMKIFEYMAMGKAVIAPQYGPIAEVIEDNINGRLFRPRDDKDLHDALEVLIADRGLREAIGERSREIVLKRHTWIQNAKRIEQTFLKFNRVALPAKSPS